MRWREKLIPFLPIFAALAFLILFLTFYFVLAIGDSEEQHIKLCKDPNCEAGKILYGVSALALTTSLFWNLFLATFIFKRHLDQYFPESQIVSWISIFIINICIWIFLWGKPVAGKGGMNYLNNILEKTQVPIYAVTNFTNLLAGTTIFMIVLSLWALANPHPYKSVQMVGEKIHSYTLSIYSTAVLMGLGIFEVHSLFSWGEAVSYGNNLPVVSLAKTLAIAGGVIFSTLMVILYLPIAVLQHDWMISRHAEATKNDPDLDFKGWLSKEGLPSSPLSIFGSYFAMLAPFVVGFITKTI